MLSDPIVTAYAGTYTNTGGVAFNLRRTGMGKFVSTDGPFSTSQPMRLTLNPKIKLLGPSTCLWRVEIDRDVAPVNGVQQQDDTAYVEIRLGGNLRSFVAADFTNLINLSQANITANIDRLLRGES